MAKRGTSNVPLIMGIIGAVIQLPGAVCAGACAAGLSSLAETSSKEGTQAADAFMYIGLLAVLLGFVGGIMGKKSPVLSGLLLLGATGMAGINLVTFNFFSMIAVILFLIGAIFAFVQDKKEITE